MKENYSNQEVYILKALIRECMIVKNIEKMPFYSINNIFSLYMEYKYITYDI